MIPVVNVPLAQAAAQLSSPKAASQATAASSTAPHPFTADEFALGSPGAPITVIEYMSVTCSHCAAFNRDTWPQVARDLVATGQVRFVIREMPTAPVAISAAGFLLARCGGEERYWPTVRALLLQQPNVLASPTLEAAIAAEAQVAGLDEASARRCLEDEDAIAAINARRQAGLDAGVDSTPFFIVNGRPLRAGARLSGQVYEGGELDYDQFLAAIRRGPPR